MSDKWRHLLFSTYCHLAVRIFLGLLFIYAGSIKIIDPQGFADILRGYDILPLFSLNIMALVLPWVEILLGAALIMPFWRGGTALLALFLFCVFFLAVSTALVRGLDVECGCFSTALGNNPVTWLTLLRDACLVVLGYYLLSMAYSQAKQTPGNDGQRKQR